MIFKTIDDDSTLSGQRIVNIFEARKIAQDKLTASLKEQAAQLEVDRQELALLEEKVKSGMTYEQAYAESIKKASAAAKEHAVSTKGDAGATDTFVAKQKKAQAELEATAASSKVAAVGIKALKLAFNMFSGLVISFAISKIIEGFQYLAESAERAKEKLEDIRTDLTDNQSSYESNRKTLEGLRDEYDSLTEKADELGGVQNLANEEYQRYTEIMSQILGITPKLITGWDDEGNAISNKNGLLQQSIDLLDEEYEKSLRNNTTKAKNEDVANGVITELNEFENRGDTKTASGTRYDLVWKDLKEYVDEAVAEGIDYTYKSTGVVGHDSADVAYAINEFVYGDSLYEATELNTAYGWLGSLQERILSSEESLKQFTESLSDSDNPIYQWFTDEQIDQLIEDFNAYFQELDRIQDDRETYYQKYKDQLNWNAQAATDGNGQNAYKQLSDESKSAITEYINNLDYASIKTSDDFLAMANDVKSFAKTLASDNTFADYINDIYTPQGKDESVEDYSKRVNDAIANVQKYIKDNNLSISLNFGTEDDPKGIQESVDKLQEKYENTINRFKDSNKIKDFFDTEGINTDEEINQFNEVTKRINDADLAIQKWNEHKKEGDKSTFTDIFTLKDSENTLTTLGMISESIDKIQNAYKTLTSAMDEYNEQGFFSIDTIQSITELGSGYLDYLVDEEGNIRLDQDAIESLTIARLEDMQAQMQQELLDRVTSIKTEADATLFAAQCYREEAQGIDMVTEAMLKNKVASLNISENAKQTVLNGATKTLTQINAMFDNAIAGVRKDPKTAIGANSSSKSKSTSSSNSSEKDYNWIEIRLSRIQKLIDRCTKSVEQFSDADMKNTGVDVLIAGTEKLQSNTQAAYNKYMQLANSVNLSDDVKALIRDGAIDVSTINNAELSKAIDKYKEYYDAAENLKDELQDINKELGELHIQKIDNIISDICDGLDYANEKMGNLISLMDDASDYDDTEITGAGLSKAYLYNVQLQNATQQAEKYNECLEELNNLYREGKLTQEQYTSKFKEYQTAQNKAVASVKQYENAIVDLIKNGIQAEIDAMDELTQKKLDALKADKEQNEYSKNIAEQQKNIANLEKQIGQLSLSDDRADKAKRLQLQQDLTDAKNKLAEDQADHSYNVTVDGLEKENQAYADAKENEKTLLDNDLSYRNQAIQGFLNNVDAEYDSIYATLDQYAENYGINLTEQLTLPWAYGETAIQSYANAISALSNIKVPDFASMMSGNGNGTATATPATKQLSGKWRIMRKDGNDWVVNNSGFSTYEEAKHFAETYIREYRFGGKKSYRFEKYKKGKLFPGNGYGITNEPDGGLEAIMTDEGLITPFNGVKAVFNNEATKHLYSFANNPEIYLKELLPKTVVPAQNQSAYGDINISNDFVINGHMNDAEKQELTGLIDNQIIKTFKKIQSKPYK